MACSLPSRYNSCQKPGTQTSPYTSDRVSVSLGGRCILSREINANVLVGHLFEFNLCDYERYWCWDILEQTAHAIDLADKVPVALGKDYFLAIAEELFGVSLATAHLGWYRNALGALLQILY